MTHEKRATTQISGIFNPRKWAALLCLVFAFGYIPLSSPLTASAGINQQIPFQGRVINTNGTNISSGSFSFVFSIYTVSSGGAAVWTETKTLTVTNGIFATYLGSVTSLPGSLDFNTDTIYLGINFNSDGEMVPRIRLGAVPQAFNAQTVNGLTVTSTTGTLTIPNATTVSFGGAFTTASSVNLAGSLTTVGANSLSITTTGATSVTFPTSGTLATLSGTETFANKTIGATTLTGDFLPTSNNTIALGTSLLRYSSIYGTALDAATLSLSSTATVGSTLTASNGLTVTTGAVNLTGTSGALSLTGLGASSISTGSNNFTITSNNVNTTATGINNTVIGATTPAAATVTTLGVTSAGTFGLNGGTGGSLVLNGSTSGAVSIKTSAAAGTYNFNLPTTAGTSGHVLTSGGGSSTAMSWTDPSGFSVTTATNLSGGAAGNIPYQSAASTTAFVGGSTGQLLTSNGSSAPTFTNIASSLTAGTNISLSGTTNATVAVVNNPTFSGLVTGQAGLTVTGAAIDLNASSNFAVNIGTGTSNAGVAIGGASNTIAITSTGLNLTTAGALSGVTTIAASGAYTQSGSGANTFSGATTFSASGTALTVTNNASFNSGTAEISGGAFYGAGASNLASGNNSYVNTASTGTIVTRNIADANAALTVNQIHASSTGSILSLQFGYVEKLSVSTAGSIATSGGYTQTGTSANAFTGTTTVGPATGVGILTVTSADNGSQLHVSGAAGNTRTIYLDTAGVKRFTQFLSNEAESGSNAGSNLYISRYADNGSWLADAFSINRASGLTTIAGAASLSSSLTVANGFTVTTGAVNITGTSGALALSGLGASSISAGSNALTITASNFNTTATGINNTAIGATTAAAGAFTTLSTSSLLTSTAGLTVTGGAVNLNASSNFAVNIGTGTTNAGVAIGGASNTVAITSTGLNLTTAGALSGVTTIAASGAYTQSGSGANTFSGATTFSASGMALTVTNGASFNSGTAVINDGRFYGAGASNTSDGNLAFVQTPSTGTLITRNVADANAALAVNQIHASSTGSLLSLQFASVEKLSVSTAGSIATSGGYVQSGTVANTFTGATTLSAAGTALTVTNNASIGGSLGVGVAPSGLLAVGTFGSTDNGSLNIYANPTSFTLYSGATAYIQSILRANIADTAKATQYGSYVDASLNYSSNSTNTVAGFGSAVYDPASTTTNLNNIIGASGTASHLGSGTVTTMTGLIGSGVNSSVAGAASNIYGVRSAVTNSAAVTTTTAVFAPYLATLANTGAASTVTDAYGLKVADLGNSGTITNTYGLYVGDITTGTQTNAPFSVYASDANAYNYFAGNVGIGTTAPVARLQIAGDQSTTAQGTSGVALRVVAATYTDTSSSGTVAQSAVSSFNAPTLAAASATTYTNAATLYIAGVPTAGSNVTITNSLSLQVAGSTALQTYAAIGGKSISGSNQLSIYSAGTYNSEGSNAIRIFDNEAVKTVSLNVGVDAALNAGYIQAMEPGVSFSTKSLLLQPNGGNVGIGNTATSSLFSVGSSSQFQVNSSGAIAASTAIANSGAYSQSGTSANTFTGATTLSAAGTALSVTNNATVGGTLGVTGVLTASTATSGLVLGTGANATTLSSTASSARAISFPDAAGTIALTTSTVSVATNLAGGAAGNIPYQSAASTTAFVGGSTGQLLTSNGSSAPTFTNIASSLTAGTNISLSGTTNATIAVADNPTFSGLVTGQAGLTVTGAAVNLNASSNFAVNIGTGTSNAGVTIGGASNTLALTSTGLNLTTAGALSGVTTIAASGAYTQTGSGANTFSGATTVSSGSLTVSNSAGAFANVVSSASRADLYVDGAAGQYRMINYRTAGNARFTTFVSNDAEAGSNAGSDFYISRYADNGSWLGNGLTITRSTGAVTLAGSASVVGGIFYGAAVGNSSDLNNSYVQTPTTGTVISRNVADANNALSVNQVNASSTGKILSLQFGGVEKMSVGIDGSTYFGATATVSGGNYYGSGLSNLSSGDNAYVQTPTTGTLITRNVADAETVLRVHQTNASSTGKLLALFFNSVEKLSVSNAGTITTPGGYTQSGSVANTFTGATTVDADTHISSANNLYLDNSDNTNYYYLDNPGATGATNSVLRILQGNVGEAARFGASGKFSIGSSTLTSLLNVGTAAQFQVDSTGAIAASTGIANSGGYTQTGTTANTISGATTFTASGTALTVNNNAIVYGSVGINRSPGSNPLTIQDSGTDAGILMRAADGGNFLRIGFSATDKPYLDSTVGQDINFLIGGSGKFTISSALVSTNQAFTASGLITGSAGLTITGAGSFSTTLSVGGVANAGYATAFASSTTLDVPAMYGIAYAAAGATYYNAGVRGHAYVVSGSGIGTGVYGVSDGTNTGTNVGGYFAAANATNNYALLTGTGNVGIGTTAPGTKLDVAGGLTLRAGATVNLTADNQVVTVGDISYIRLSSDNATSTNRTMVLTVGLQQGQVLTLEWTGANAGELVDDSANSGTGNVRLSATWTPAAYGTLSLLWNGTDWIETGRSAN